MRHMLPLCILIPLAAAFVCALAGRLHRRVAELVACAACGILAVMSCVIVASLAGRAPLIYRLGAFMPPAGIPMVVDGLSGFMLVVANGISLAVAVYSTGYMRRYTDTWKYYSLLMVAVAGVNGVVLSGDIFNLFVYLEIASIAAYALVAFGTEEEALEASFKYAVMSAVASSFLLLGIGILYSYTSTLNLAGMGAAIAAAGGSAAMAVRFVSVLVLMGLGLKAALAPFHTWMPDAYTRAPAPVPALSSGVLVKTLGVYALARLFFNVFGMNAQVGTILTSCAVISMVLGSVMAFGQTNLKRLLGYSSISQIGYIFLGLGIGTPLAVTAALFHLLNHSVAKSLLFFNAGEIETVSGAGEGGAIVPLAGKRPVVALTTLAGAFSVCGIPPFAGFWSKLFIVIACVQAHRPGLACIAVVVSMLTIAYYCKAFTPILYGQAPPADAGRRVPRQSIAAAAVLLLLAFAALAGGALLLPGIGKGLIANAAAALTNGIGYASVVTGAMR